MKYTDDVPELVEEQLRAICLALPDAYEQAAWVGTRWKVRNHTFANVLGVTIESSDDVGYEPGDSLVLVAFRASGDELEVLRHAGPPFVHLGWGRDAIGMVLDAEIDVEEVRELLVESYCTRAPKKLVAQIDRPPEPG
jgi:hypothetical protein